MKNSYKKIQLEIIQDEAKKIKVKIRKVIKEHFSKDSVTFLSGT